MFAILHTVAPLYILIALGVVLRLVVADDKWIEVFNKFGLYLGFPAIVFSSLMKTRAGGIVDLRTIACNVLLLLGALLLTYFVCRIWRLTTSLRNTYFVCVFYGNIAYLGFPFITSVIPGSDAAVSIHIAVYVAFLFTIGVLMLELSRGWRTSSIPAVAKSIVANPLLLSVVSGLLLRSARVQLPVFVGQSIDLLASTAAPIVLLAIGMFLARRIRLDRDLLHAAILSGLKLVALPSCFLLYAGLSSPNDGFAISIIEAAMPVGITIFALAEVYPMEKKIVASAIVLSTLVSAITLPLWASCVV